MYRVHANSTPSHVSSLVTPCTSLQSRRALRSSSQAEFFVTRSLRKAGNRAFALAVAAEWHRRRLWGQPGHAPPIIKMGAKPPFAPNYQTRIFYFFILKKHERKQKKQRQR